MIGSFVSKDFSGIDKGPIYIMITALSSKVRIILGEPLGALFILA